MTGNARSPINDHKYKDREFGKVGGQEVGNRRVSPENRRDTCLYEGEQRISGGKEDHNQRGDRLFHQKDQWEIERAARAGYFAEEINGISAGRSLEDH